MESDIFRFIEQNSTHVTWIYNLEDQCFDYISPSVEKMRGYTLKEAMDQGFHESMDAADFQYVMNHLKPRIDRYEQGEESLQTLTHEIRQPCKNGQMIWVEVTTTLLKNPQGRVHKILGVSHEITQKKTQQEIEQETQNLFERVYDFTGTGIALMREDGSLINVNSGLCKILGFPKSYVMEKIFFDFLLADDIPVVKEIFEQSRKEKNFDKKIEIRMVNLHDQVIWGLLNITGINLLRENHIHWIIQLEEITARKKADEVIRLLNADLTLKNNEMERLVYVTSHDLRSPLVNIQGFTNELKVSIEQLLNQWEKHGWPEDAVSLHSIKNEIAESFDYIKTSIDKMDKLLEGLLSFSRLGKKRGSLQTVNMDSLMANVVKSYEYTIKTNKIRVELSPLPNCLANQEMLHQVFSNLLENCIKYRDPLRQCEIRIGAKIDFNRAIYSVEDNGLGIEPKYHQKVFELFFRIHPEKLPGEGMGLATVKKILDLYNGKIFLESTPGKGSKIFVSLPVKEKAG